MLHDIFNVARKISKKGIDEKIATILLVGFIIALLVLGFLWVRGFMKSRAAKELALSEKQFECKDISITAKDVASLGENIGLTLENKKEIKVEKFSFRLMVGDESITVESFDVLNGLEIKNYEINKGTLTEVDEIDVIPWVKAARNVFVPCSQQHVVVSVS